MRPCLPHLGGKSVCFHCASNDRLCFPNASSNLVVRFNTMEQFLVDVREECRHLRKKNLDLESSHRSLESKYRDLENKYRDLNSRTATRPAHFTHTSTTSTESSSASSNTLSPFGTTGVHISPNMTQGIWTQYSNPLEVSYG
jgi:predicted nuclease with TOPRIM domain